jgi:hypothetical protein
MRFLVIAFGVAILAGTAHAQSAGPPTFSVGDTWTFTNRTQSVVKVEGDTVVMTGVNARCATCLYYFDKGLLLQKITQEDGKTPDSATMGFMPVGPDWKVWSFPLEVNKKWSFSASGYFNNRLYRYTGNIEVEVYEDVKTKAGTFKAFRLRREWAARAPGASRDLVWTSTEWFAPDVKASVKFTSTNRDSQESELTAYSLK